MITRTQVSKRPCVEYKPTFMTVCKNCQSNFESKYCPDCGQKASIKRFSTRILFSQLMDKLLPLDRGVLFTARHILTKPGKMLRGYLNGKRVGYTKPFQFLLIVTAISLLVFSQDDFKQQMTNTMASSNGNSKLSPEFQAFQQKLADFVTTHLNLIMIGMIPLLALTGRWFYKKHDVNYAEHFVMNCYLLAGCSIITMPFMWLLRVMGRNIYDPGTAAFFSIFYVGFYVWAHISFFREPNRIWNGLKGMLTYLIAYGLYMLAIGLVSIIITIVYISLT